ncbi:oxygen-regulated protein 1 [Clupea harengus]|uniref:Oxygen-regulated protein 1 n=1 Tax=Clupea harengus TaxID=7950 RepID=A0A6P8GLV5_CLUHA|nr:oxygen-regulated protein 1 [Clupea harengus]
MSDEGPSPRHGPPQALSSGSGRTNMTAWRQPYLHEPISSKHVCFYKSGDTQFSGLPVVINNRTFKTFESLLDSLSRRVPLPFGVRHITTPRGHTTVRSLDQLHHGHSYICSDQRTVKPVDLERARRRPPPWYHARPASGPRRKALTKQRVEIRPRRRRHGRGSTPHLLSTPKRLVVFRNGEPEEKHTLLLQKRNARSFEALLDYVSEVMHFPVVKLYMPDGRRVDGLPALILCFGVLVAAGREPFKAGYYDIQRPTAPTWLPAKRAGTKWVHPSRRKKKSGSSSLKSRIFSPSSERFFVNQIHHSAAGSGGEG